MYSNKQYQGEELLTRVALIIASVTLLLLMYLLPGMDL